MGASERARRYREADRDDPLRSWLGWEAACALGVACLGGLAYVLADLLDAASERWWAVAAAIAMGLLAVLAARRSAR